MLDYRAWIFHFDVRKCMRAALLADQQGIALRVVAGAGGALLDLDQAAIAVLSAAGADALGDDFRLRVAADMDHLGAGVRLLAVMGQRHRVEFPNRIVTAQDAAGILPGDRRTSFNLGPDNLRACATTVTALGNEVVDAADAILVTGIPVLHGRILDVRVVQCDQLDDRRVQLILIAHRCCAAFEIGDAGALLGDDHGAFKLARVAGIDTEIRAQLHRAAHALRDEHETAIGEHGGIERSEIVVSRRYDRSKIFAHQLGMLADRLGH